MTVPSVEDDDDDDDCEAADMEEFEESGMLEEYDEVVISLGGAQFCHT